jgi:PI-3-kinase-related kinase SMG-1
MWEARGSRGLLLASPSQRRVQEEVFFLQRLLTIRDFFRLCSSFARTLSGKSPPPGREPR